jgi:Cu/Ag efflux pump CusA
MHFIETAFAGMEVGQIFEGQRYFDLVLRYPKEKRQSEAALRNTLMELPNGQRIPLNTLAEITSWSSPNSISREDVQRKVVVSANVQGRDLRSAVEELQLSLKENIALPRGYRLAFGGQFESEAKASQLLSLSAGIAVLVIYLLLFFEFRQAKLAAIVLLNLPLALIGGILIVYFSSGTLSIAATIGFISLFGIATRNGILMISRDQDLAMRGLRGDELIIKGTLDRLNPIIMTALTTALALIPLALKGQEAGNEIQSPMAVVILGGLFSATLLNLLVIPGVYKLLSAKDV